MTETVLRIEVNSRLASKRKKSCSDWIQYMQLQTIKSLKKHLRTRDRKPG